MRLATLFRLRASAIAVCAVIVAACAAAQNAEVRQQTAQEPTPAPTQQPVKKDVPYVPTPQNVVDEMLTLANVTKNDVVYDLGCGDGRLVITAVKKFGAKRASEWTSIRNALRRATRTRRPQA